MFLFISSLTSDLFDWNLKKYVSTKLIRVGRTILKQTLSLNLMYLKIIRQKKFCLALHKNLVKNN